MTLAYSESASDSVWTKLGGALLNAIVFLALILLATVVLVVLYKYRCLKVIYGWLLLTTGLLLGLFGGGLLYAILATTGVVIDWLSFAFYLWNLAVVGIVAIFWHSPAAVNQAALVAVSCLMATIFTYLPEWTLWAVLAIIAIYDLFAVLCPRGPLRVLVETAQERQEPIPALLYNASLTSMMARTEDEEEEEEQQEGEEEQEEGEGDNVEELVESSSKRAPNSQRPGKGGGVKLGLGDFVFYSVLVGHAAQPDYHLITVAACFIGIIIGLLGTLLLLAVFRKALPALPISIGLGIFFFFMTEDLVAPLVLSLGKAGVMA